METIRVDRFKCNRCKKTADVAEDAKPSGWSAGSYKEMNYPRTNYFDLCPTCTRHLDAFLNPPEELKDA